MPAPRARLTIDLDALAANHAVLKQLAGAAEVAPVVKADGYGLGAGPVARRLWAEGAHSFFVARLEEGEALRAELGGQRPARIFVLDGAASGAAAARLFAAGLLPVLNSPAQVEAFAAFARAHMAVSGPLPCGLHVDTGMHRLGVTPDELEVLASAPDRLQGLDIELLMSHLACADQEEHRLNAQQAGRFKQALTLLPGVAASLANTGGVFLGPAFHHQLVRPGIGLYGGGPFGRTHPQLKPVATFHAPILQVRAVSQGETIGYGATFTADRAYRVAVVAAGYADGVLRSSAGRGRAWFGGDFRPVLGRISMDLMVIDVTGCEDARPGALVELLGPHVTVDDAAEAAGTASYEVLTRLGCRAERVYLGIEG
ncbi:MAG TPA: alanine racemase [Caulobacteraceae bacterium]|jgi:alanine racemase